jgi:hypothetical protein
MVAATAVPVFQHFFDSYGAALKLPRRADADIVETILFR